MHVNAQNNTVATLEKQFDEYQKKSLQEKIFVHTDKNLYVAGEILWFKIYNVDASFHQPIDMSKVAYVEIIDRNNKPLLQAKISMKDGHGNGSFYLPVNINSGNYKLRAYTSWMKNYSPDYFFEKIVTFINTRKVIDSVVKEKQLVPSIVFFPEGGNLVNNIQSRLAFKAVDGKGKGLEEFTGIITNEKSDTIIKFSPLKFGMGSFDFTPIPGHQYKAFISTPEGIHAIADLPVANNEGYAMHVEGGLNNQIRITVNGNTSATSEIYLFVHTRQSVKLAVSENLQNGVAHFTIDKNKLGDGISSFTIFNSNKQPQCERLYFKYPERKLLIETATDKTEYDQRSKISFQINTANEKGKTQGADLSMAVYRLDSLQATEDNDINSYFWLTSDLKGTIESPSYYFDQPDKAKEEALDNLLLTQGWRRFRWENIVENKMPSFEFAPEYHGHIISGKVVNAKTGAPDRYMESFVSIRSTRTQVVACVSDSIGNVKFEMPDMFGSSEIILQISPTRDSLVRIIDVNNPFSEKFSSASIPEFGVPLTHPNTLLDKSVSMQVQNIYTGEKLRQSVFPAIDTSTFYKTPSSVYLLDNYTRFTTMEEVLREYVANMTVRKKNGVFNLHLFNFAGNQSSLFNLSDDQFFDSNPLMLMDGIPVFDTQKIMDYDPLKVRKLEVLNAMYFSGNTYFFGIMNFTTYKGDLPGFELDPRAIVMDYEGLQVQREFYSPVYESEQQLSNHLPDFRNLLYWSPNVITNETGKKQVTFYTSDLPGKYIAILQGNTTDGKCGSKSIMFEVK